MCVIPRKAMIFLQKRETGMNSQKMSHAEISTILYKFILAPIASGLYGFAAFFLVIIISKYIGTLIGSLQQFSVDVSDVQLSFLGFFFIFLINFLKNLQNYKSTE